MSNILYKKFLFLFIAVSFIIPQIIFADLTIINSSTVSISATVGAIAPPSPVPSGGGGGGGGTVSIPTAINFSGIAYTSAKVYILKDGSLVSTTVASSGGIFSATITGLDTYIYTFTVYAEDSTGRKSSVFSIPVSITPKANINIANILLSPTVDMDKVIVKKGDSLSIYGVSNPNSEVVITIKGTNEYTYKVSASSTGIYSYNLDTSILAFGSYDVKAKSILNGSMSLDTSPLIFKVGTENKLKGDSYCGFLRGDINCDMHVNIVDFSMMAYWYKKPNPPAKIDLNNDDVITLADFSILAYNWTG